MKTLEESATSLDLRPLDDMDTRTISGGDRITEGLFWGAGYVWQTARNLLENYSEFLREHPHPHVYV